MKPIPRRIPTAKRVRATTSLLSPEKPRSGLVEKKRDHLEVRATQDRAVSGHESYSRIYAVVKQIPPGKVATYGQIATLAGMRRRARQVGYALHTLAEHSGVPWHRVINARGEISPRTWSENHLLQRILLEGEGVTFDARGRVDVARFAWTPDLA